MLMVPAETHSFRTWWFLWMAPNADFHVLQVQHTFFQLVILVNQHDPSHDHQNSAHQKSLAYSLMGSCALWGAAYLIFSSKLFFLTKLIVYRTLPNSLRAYINFLKWFSIIGSCSFWIRLINNFSPTDALKNMKLMIHKNRSL